MPSISFPTLSVTTKISFFIAYDIQKALDNLMQNKTVIAIAHRLSTLRSMDRIIVLDKGKIIEDDNPKNLLKNKESTFKYFYSLQTDGYINLKNKGDINNEEEHDLPDPGICYDDQHPPCRCFCSS